MRQITLISALFFILCSNSSTAQNLQIETFGNKKDKPVIFLHGGPGYNSVTFEKTTAKELSDNGFYVISYDRRGEGRNEKLSAEYTFAQTIEDLNQIYDLDKAIIIGHSFGGVIATFFADKFSEKIESVILISTPISMQETLKNIIDKSKLLYQEKNDKMNLYYIDMLEKMDKASLEYSSYCFMHAMSNGFYSTKNPNEKAVELYKSFQADSVLKKYASKMEYLAPKKFWENESYTTISIKENLKELKNNNIKVYAIYGKEDGLYSKEQVVELKNILGSNSVEYLDNCSHNVFIDQQDKFVELLQKWNKK